MQCYGASEARSRGGTVIIMWPELNHGCIRGRTAEPCWSAGMGGISADISTIIFPLLLLILSPCVRLNV